MKNNKFYSPIKSLINLILTGERKIDQDSQLITVVQGFTDSLSSNNSDDYNIYILIHIEEFLSSCSQEEKVDIIKVLFDNEDLITGVLFINRLTDSKSLKENDFSDTLNSTLASYIIDNEVHPILTFSFYFYIESISKITIVNGQMTKSDYKKIIEFHSIKRDLKKLFSF
ncbi:hypothetical protein [Flavobacterium frigoris]|uniref:Uncharacterized protein n=1 Tax=Flavobacterium frigoris TaxID=229204 RepID=A0A1H9RUV8_FLAFI|nr:hypothetical protein [Flavobacterium frigoris]SER76437.1 hypothetical protein SAMN05444355_1258 [Flavobacterium frigoris]